MQFHFDGFRTGDPEVAVADASVEAGGFPEAVDVLIVGCGPAGLTLAAQLSAFPDIVTRIVEQKPGPLELGQADGIACRTMEMFDAFGFSERVMKEGYWVNETSFWRPDLADPSKIVRYDRVQDVEDGLSEFPHMILNQARVHDFYLQVMCNSPRRLSPDYGKRFTGLAIDPAQSHPVQVTLQKVGSEESEVVRAKYVVGCDGARSAVRQALGRTLQGDSANQAWGVMDVLAVTDFPDIRLKVLIQSAGEGSIVLIPREGGFLVRIYVELEKLNADERLAGKSITVDQLIAATRRILAPYSFDVREVAWWSVYEIGQRLCEKFDDVPEAEIGSRVPRVFIAGDACHTHSPKAGQGMNVSMQDGFNLGWKLAHVLRGQCAPEFLHSYSAERHAVAKELINFDREWAKMISAPLKKPGVPDSEGVDPEAVRAYFVKHGRYTAGTATRYAPSMLTGNGEFQNLAQGFAIGTRFHAAPVVRLADAKEMSLGECGKADGRWRIYAFGDNGDPAAPSSRIRALCEFLSAAEESPLLRYRREGQDIDAVIDLRAVFQQPHRSLRIETMPTLLLPEKGRLGLRDYEKMFCADPRAGRDIFDLRDIDRSRGCQVIVRPDQYVAEILPLDDYRGLSSFFRRFMRPPPTIQDFA
ncbi:MAG TPA: FAD-binding monooxygenase [Xanthobacteraceae bacterium]|nr:FAD-binding monooxygenase [Xanthobacteraceae bacterium]